MLLKHVLPANMLDKKLSDIKNKKMLEVAEEVLKWDYETPPVCSLISRHCGIGKTHIAILSLKNFVRKFFEDNFDNNVVNYSNEVKHFNDFEARKPVVRYTTESDLLYYIQTTFRNDSSEDEGQILKRLCNADFLLLDDLFSNRKSDNEFARRVILYILNKRVEEDCKPIIVTSNVALEEIDAIDSRIASRLNNELCFNIKTEIPDFRAQKFKTKKV